MTWQLARRQPSGRVLVMVSKFGHCLNDLLFRCPHRGAAGGDRRGGVQPPGPPRSLVEWHGIPFFHVPVTAGNKPEAEARLLDLVDQFEIDLVVLARYMQVLSDSLAALSGRAINIHHSFLPCFKGAKPYHQAYERGVKTVGATAHYVNGELDEGPIIAQQVVEVDHTFGPEDLVAAGRDTECKALSNAVKWHCEGGSSCTATAPWCCASCTQPAGRHRKQPAAPGRNPSRGGRLPARYSKCVGANILSSVSTTTTFGPSAAKDSSSAARTSLGAARRAGIPKDSASATKSGRASSVAVALPNAPTMYSRRIPYPPSSTISQVTGTLCCLAVASSAIEYIADPSPETARTRPSVPVPGHGQTHGPADRRRVAEAEPAGALGGVELAGARVPAAPRPVGGDGHVPERLHRVRDRRPDVRHERPLLAEVLRVQPGLHLGQRLGNHHLGRLAVPVGAVVLRPRQRGQHAVQVLEGGLGVGANAQRRHVGFEHARLGVDLDHPPARGEREVVGGDFPQRGSDDDQHVGVLQDLGHVAVLHPGLQAQRVRPREGAVAPGRADHGRAQLLGHPQQRVPGVRPAHPSPGHDGRAARGGQPAHGLLDQFHPGRVLVGHGERVGHRRHQHGGQQHVLRHLDPHRPLRPW